MKKALSLLLAILMLVSVMCAAPISINAGSEVQKISVYFENNWLWTKVFYHAWGSTLDTNTNSWGTGVVEKVGKSVNGHDVYKAEIGADSTGLIFAGTKNDGSGATDQTPDIKTGIADGNCYSMTWDNGNKVVVKPIAEVCPDLVPTTTAPVVTTTAAPVVTTTAAPVVTTTAAPVVTTTAAPVVTDAPEITTTATPVVTDAPEITTTAAPVVTDAPEITTTAAPVVTDAPVVETISVYFENNWLWTNVFYHAWGSTLDTNTGEWGTGVVEKVGISVNGHDVYKVEIGADTTGLIFAGTKNDGSGAIDQTPNIETGIADGNCYSMTWDNGNKVVVKPIAEICPDLIPTTTAAPVVTTTAAPVVTTTAAPVVTDAPEITTTAAPVVTDAPEITTTAAPVVTDAPEITTTAAPVVTDAPETDTYTVYYVDSAYFETVYAYAWSDGIECAEMPGVEMTLTDMVAPDGSPVYECTFDVYYDYIIFGDGEEVWTAEVDFMPGQYLYWNDDSWYENLDEVGVEVPVYIPEGYYLVGSFYGNEDEWHVDEYSDWRMFTENEENPGEYTLRWKAYEGDEMQVVYFDGTEITEWYNSNDDSYIISEEEAGNGTIYFRPEGNSGWANNYFIFMKDVCEHEFNANGLCVKCFELKEGVPAAVLGYSARLRGRISVEQRVFISKEVLKDENAKMILTVPDTGSSYEIVVPVDEFEKSGDTYVFNCAVAAKEISSVFSMKLVTSTGEYEVGSFTLKSYCEALIRSSVVSDQIKDIARALLNYGAAAQEYFNYNTDNLANDTEYMTEEEKVLVDKNLENFAHTVDGEEAGVTYYGTALSLKSETAIKHYFIVEDGIEPVFTVNGEEVTATKSGNYYIVKISDISAHMLGDNYEVCVGGLTLNYSAFSFAKIALEGDNDALKKISLALVAFYEAACVFA